MSDDNGTAGERSKGGALSEAYAVTQLTLQLRHESGEIYVSDQLLLSQRPEVQLSGRHATAVPLWDNAATD